MKKTIIAIDIGASSIKLAQAVLAENGPVLNRLISVDMAPAKEGYSAAFLEEGLRKALKGIEYKNSNTILVLDSPKTIAQKIILPPMPRQELKNAISLEAKNLFPFSIEDSRLDFEIIGNVVEKGIKKLELLVSALPGKVMDDALEACGRMALRPSLAIHDSIALKNLIVRLAPGEKSVAALDIGSNITELVIVDDNRIWLDRKIHVSGKDFTDSLTGALVSDMGKVELSAEEAERIKRDIGIPEDTASRDLVEKKISCQQIFSMLRPLAEKLAEEIGRSLDYHREQTGESVNKLILFGGGGLLKGLAKFLSEHLAIEVEPGNPVKAMSSGLSEQGIDPARFACAVGGILSGPKGLNMLPPEYKEMTSRLIKKTVLKAATAAGATILALTFFGLEIQLSALDKKLYGARIQLESLKPGLAEVTERAVVSDILDEEPYWAESLKELGALLPESVYINEADMSRNILKLRGFIIAGSRNAEAEIAAFIKALEEGIFRNVKLLYTRRKADTHEFEITCAME